MEELNKLWWVQTGERYDYHLYDWDPDTATWSQCLLELLSEGLTVVLRPGSGGRAVGIAIWQGDNRPPAKWFNDHDELNAWTAAILLAASQRRGKGSENGA